MSSPQAEDDRDERTPISILGEIQGGSLSPKNLSKEERNACIDYLHADGRTAVEIGEILKCSSRTVYRALERLREERQFRPDPEFLYKQIGEFMRCAELGYSRLRRIGGDRNASPMERIEAERAAWGIQKDVTDSLIRMGILPSAAHQVRATMTHELGESAQAAVMAKEIVRLSEVIGSSTAQAELAGSLTEIGKELLHCQAQPAVEGKDEDDSAKSGE